MLNTSLSLPTSHVRYQSDSAFLIQLYAVADKYDVPPLRSLILERLEATCDPVEHETDFIDALRVVDECTADNSIWKILLPKLKTNLQTLLKNQAFREAVTEQPAMTLQLLDFLAPDSCTSSPQKSKARPSADVVNPTPKRLKTSGSEDLYRGFLDLFLAGSRDQYPPTSAAPDVSRPEGTSLTTRVEDPFKGRAQRYRTKK